MIHKNIYYFIDKFDRNEILSLDKKINIIYRNYKEINIDPTIKKIKEICGQNNRKLYISNNLKIALKFNLDGLYLPAFNKGLKYKNINSKKSFKIVGSAHSYEEIKIKEKQGCEEIFITPIFDNPKNKYFLDWFYVDFKAILDPKMSPQTLPKSSPNRPKSHLGAN